MNWYVIDVEEMPEAIKSKNLKDAVKIAESYISVRKMQKDEYETYGVKE